MERSAITDDRLPRIVSAALLALVCIAAVAGFAQSYLRWMDPIIDAGRDLYISEQITRGATLYRDIRYVYPPLTPYALAAWVAAFGASLASFAAFGLATGLACAAALFALVRRASSLVAAAATALLFVALNLFGASSWGCNYVFPYTYSATIGLLAYLLFGWCVVGFDLRRRWTIFAAVCAVVAAWSKLEFTFAVAVVCVALLFVPRARALVVWIAGIGAATFGLVWLAFRGNPPGHHWLFDNVLVSSLLGGASSSRFYAEVFGSDAPATHLVQIATGAALIAGVATLLAVYARRDSRGMRLVIVIGVATLTIALASDDFFKAWAALQVFLLPFAFRDRLRSPLLLLLALSLGTSIRIFLNLKPGWYGFVFAVPTYALIAFVLFEYLPWRGIYSRRAALAWLPLLVVLSAMGFLQQRDRYALKRFAIETPRGTVIDANLDRAEILNQAIPFIHARRPAGLVAIPEGLAVNYLAGVTTPLSFHMFIPPEAADHRIELRILEEMKAKRPEMIAIDSRDVREFGSRGFGVDYDVELNAWIRENYRIERGWIRPGSPGFSLILLRRAE